MEGPGVEAITESLERSFRSCSLNDYHHQQTASSSSGCTATGDGGAVADSHGEDSTENRNLSLELNSDTSLPYDWEQCLDLKTGEIYYINWRTGMKAKEDPRTTRGDYYCSDDDESSSCDSEGASASESSPSSSRVQWIGGNDDANQENCYCPQRNDDDDDHNNNIDDNIINKTSNNGNVLVVAGCKSCLMYYMVPKQLEICPKCCGQLLHFDGSENGSS